MFVGEMSIWQWVSQALRKLASVLDKQHCKMLAPSTCNLNEFLSAIFRLKY